MEILNNISKIYFTEFLYRNNQIVLFKLLQLNKGLQDYFYQAAIRYRYVDQANLNGKMKFVQQLSTTTYPQLDIKNKQYILAQAAKYDLLYPFTKINADEVADSYTKFRGRISGQISRRINLNDPNQNFYQKNSNGYFFQNGALLNIAVYYNSQQVAKFLMQNNNYTIDYHGKSHDYIGRINFIINSTNTEYEHDFNDTVYQQVDIITPLKAMGFIDENALDIAAYKDNLEMVKLLTNYEDLDSSNGSALYMVAIQYNFNIVNYLLDHHVSMDYDDGDAYEPTFFKLYVKNNNYIMANYILDYIINNNIKYYLDDVENNNHSLVWFATEGVNNINDLQQQYLINKFRTHFKH